MPHKWKPADTREHATKVFNLIVWKASFEIAGPQIGVIVSQEETTISRDGTNRVPGS